MGDILIILRSVSVQDKAISIGFLMTCIAFMPGKILYDVIANAKEFVSYPRWHEARQLSLLHDRFFVGFVRYIEIGRVVSIRRFEALRPERGGGNIDDRNEGNDFKHE